MAWPQRVLFDLLGGFHRRKSTEVQGQRASSLSAMGGLTWTLVIWVMVLLVLGREGVLSRQRGRRLHLSRIEVAIIAVLLGTHSLVGGSNVEDILANPVVLERVIRGALSGVGLLLVVPNLRATIPELKTGHWPAMTALSAYAGVAAASVLYSAAPIVTVGKVFELSAGLAIAWALLSSSSVKQHLSDAIRLVVVLEGAIIGVALIGFFVLPDMFTSFGDSRPGFLLDRVMGSPSAHPNTLSASGALVAAYALAAVFRSESRSEKVQWMVWSIVGTLSMLFASGRQGLVIWLAAVAVLLWIHRRRLFIVVIAPLTALVLVANWEVLWDAITRNQSSETLATLSSRLIWWGAAIEAWKSHPFTGYGYGVGGRFVALRGLSNTASVHSGYLEALVGLGLIGTLLLMIVLTRVALWAVPRLRQGLDTTAPILVIPLLLHTGVSLGFAGWLNADFLLFAFLALSSDLAFRERRRLGRLPPDRVVAH